MSFQRLEVIDRSDARITDVSIAGAAFSEIEIIGWDYTAGLRGETIILDSENHLPASSDLPREVRSQPVVAALYAPGMFPGVRVENSMNAREIRMRVYEPVHIFAKSTDADVLIIASRSVGMKRHIAVKRASTETVSLRSAYSISDPEATELTGGPMLARYVPGIEGSPTLQVGGGWPEIETLDGACVKARSYLQIPVHADVPTCEVQVLIDNVGNSKDVIATALLGLSACGEWKGKSVSEIEQSMRSALGYLRDNSGCRIIEAVITTRDESLIRLD